MDWNAHLRRVTRPLSIDIVAYVNLYARERSEGIRVRDHEMVLYDLEADPGETRNAIQEHPQVAERLGQELDAFLAENWRSAPAGGAPVPFDPLERELLRQLGYVD